MNKQTKKWVVGSSIIGALSGAIFLAANEKTRTGVTCFVSSATDQTKHWLTVINENRDTVTDQIRSSSEKVSTIVEAASEDIQKIVESSQSLKGHAFDLLSAIQDSKDEIKDLKIKLQTGQSVDVLPEPEDTTYKIE